MCGYAGWSVPLLFACNTKLRVSRVEAHMLTIFDCLADKFEINLLAISFLDCFIIYYAQ